CSGNGCAGDEPGISEILPRSTQSDTEVSLDDIEDERWIKANKVQKTGKRDQAYICIHHGRQPVIHAEVLGREFRQLGLGGGGVGIVAW
ncbi:hypothetical protein PHISCL_10879, partial [Aspergillus sclerotialis]